MDNTDGRRANSGVNGFDDEDEAEAPILGFLVSTGECDACAGVAVWAVVVVTMDAG